MWYLFPYLWANSSKHSTNNKQGKDFIKKVMLCVTSKLKENKTTQPGMPDGASSPSQPLTWERDPPNESRIGQNQTYSQGFPNLALLAHTQWIPVRAPGCWCPLWQHEELRGTHLRALRHHFGSEEKRKQLPSQLSQLIPTATRPCRAKPEPLASIFTPAGRSLSRQQQGEGHRPAQPPAPRGGLPHFAALPPRYRHLPAGLSKGSAAAPALLGRPSPVRHRPVPLREAQSPGGHREHQQQQQPGAAAGRPHGVAAWLWAPRRARHRPCGGEHWQGARPRGRDQNKRRKLRWGCFSFFIFYFSLLLRKSACWIGPRMWHGADRQC